MHPEGLLASWSQAMEPATRAWRTLHATLWETYVTPETRVRIALNDEESYIRQALVASRGLHSSSFRLDLSRSC
jgi:hypothetical protein